ncbi:hypothetical protein DMR_09530 [Solidesulfovibrio magneticus RS-1]|uniref:Uncharacterized protein n=1 Tax=Solidesulfovibrio magneticus (strain ATCC 700980 / DSM 13731 / RS-1) TaxID=573370 RepID=C4XKQ3_SOLM1|nr:hypothetical protein DMR_09530 [Solidesulfovibrio magneticus RS-1]
MLFKQKDSLDQWGGHGSLGSLSWTKPYGNRTLGVGRDFLGFWPRGSPLGEL